MTDPASIFSIVSGSAGLVLQLGKVINDLHNVSERYRLAELTIGSMRHNLTTVQWAWRRIKTILVGWEKDDEPLPDDTIELFAQLNRSLEGGSLVISALEDDLKRFQEIPDPTRRTNPTQRARIVWNEQTLKDHQERIRDQVSSMTLVLEVMRMPEPAARKQALDRGERVFQQSDESAFSIVPSKFSRSIRDSESLLSFESEPSLVYHELSVDSDLFTARVYKRNYRTAFIRKLLRKDKVLSVKSQGALDRVQGVPAAFETVQKDPDTETVSGTASESSVASLELPDNWIVCPAEEWGTSKQKARDMAETRGSERYDMNTMLPDLLSQIPRILRHHTPMWKVGDVSTLRISGFAIKEITPEDCAQICGEDDCIDMRRCQHEVGDVSTLRISGFAIKEITPEDYARICGEDDCIDMRRCQHACQHAYNRKFLYFLLQQESLSSPTGKS